MKTFLLDIESHPFNYFKHFELEKHSYKINTGMSCYPLRILFFSKYLQWDVGRMMSSGQIINHPSASMGTGKDPNSVWRRELLDAIRKRPQTIKDHEREKYCQTRLTKHAGRQILNSKGCLNTWTDYHSTNDVHPPQHHWNPWEVQRQSPRVAAPQAGIPQFQIHGIGISAFLLDTAHPPRNASWSQVLLLIPTQLPIIL